VLEAEPYITRGSKEVRQGIKGAVAKLRFGRIGGINQSGQEMKKYREGTVKLGKKSPVRAEEKKKRGNAATPPRSDRYRGKNQEKFKGWGGWAKESKTATTSKGNKEREKRTNKDLAYRGFLNK